MKSQVIFNQGGSLWSSKKVLCVFINYCGMHETDAVPFSTNASYLKVLFPYTTFILHVCYWMHHLIICPLSIITSCLFFHISLLSLSLSPSFSLFSLLQSTAFPIHCRDGYIHIQEGITEKTSLVTTVSVAMLFTNFYKWFVWSHEWKMTTLLLQPKKQVGESCSLAIRNLMQVLNESAWLHSPFLLLIPLIKRINQGFAKALKSGQRPLKSYAKNKFAFPNKIIIIGNIYLTLNWFYVHYIPTGKPGLKHRQ